MTNNDSRPTLRDLPLPAKLVVTVFLLSVGLGYCWAIMQLHFKHASKGSFLPTPNDVVERFSGQRAPWDKEEAGPAEEKPAGEQPQGEVKMVAAAKIKAIIDARCCECHCPEGERNTEPFNTYAGIKKFLDDHPPKGKIHRALARETDDKFDKDNMVQAFTRKTVVEVDKKEVKWDEFIKTHAKMAEKVVEERVTERLVLLAWIEAGAPEEAYTKDAFVLPAALTKRPMTIDFITQAPEPPKDQAAAPKKKKKNPKDRQLSVDSLTQSTHAHLLSFSVLWALTGIVFAFTSYPLWMRLGIAPIVLIAQVADICFWWLARMPGVGPYFALAIMGTGGVVGMGLGAQIVLSLFNMYGGKGKLVILLLLIGGGGTGGLIYAKYIAPMVAEEKQAAPG